MKCPKCGNEYEGKFCPECGTPAAQTSAPQNAALPNGGLPPVQPQKKKGGCLKIVLIVIGVLFVLGVIGAIFGEPADPASDAVPSGTSSSVAAAEPTPAPTPEPTPSYIEVSATDLLAAYEENTVSADNQYKDQLLKVTGTVGSIGKDILDDAYVTLTNDDEYSLISVQCYFAKDNLDGIATLKEGDTVSIIGKCDGSTLNVLLKNCDLVVE